MYKKKKFITNSERRMSFMNNSTSIAEKKDFLKWFLKNHRFHKRECVWLLNYFISDDLVMENLHFVEHAKFCPKAIILSTKCSNETPFQFVKENIVTSDIEKSFHDIRLNPDEQVYIQLNFKHSHKNVKYSLIVEDNPYLPDDLQPIKQYAIWADFILDESIFKYKIDQLNKQINQALDNYDKKTFLQLSEQLKKLVSPC